MNPNRTVFYTHSENVGLCVVVEAKHNKRILTGYGAGHATKLDRLLSDENIESDHPDSHLILYEKMNPAHNTFEITKDKINMALYIIRKYYNATNNVKVSHSDFFSRNFYPIK